MTTFRPLLGLLLIPILVVGCKPAGPKELPAPKPAPGKTQAEPGWLFATPNEQFHMRVLLDDKNLQARVTVLDENAKNPEAIKAEKIIFTIKNGKAVLIDLLPENMDKSKGATTYTGKHERFADKIEPKKVEISAEIEGKNFIFALDEAHGPAKK